MIFKKLRIISMYVCMCIGTFWKYEVVETLKLFGV